MREWLASQMEEKQRIGSEKREANRQYELRSRELDRRAVELSRNCEESRRQLERERKSDNVRQAEERRSSKQQAQAQEQDDNLAELSNWIRSDLLSENPEVSQSAFGTHRVVTDRWKGFTPEQVLMLASPYSIPLVTTVAIETTSEGWAVRAVQRERGAEDPAALGGDGVGQEPSGPGPTGDYSGHQGRAQTG